MPDSPLFKTTEEKAECIQEITDEVMMLLENKHPKPDEQYHDTEGGDGSQTFAISIFTLLDSMGCGVGFSIMPS